MAKERNKSSSVYRIHPESGLQTAPSGTASTNLFEAYWQLKQMASDFSIHICASPDKERFTYQFELDSLQLYTTLSNINQNLYRLLELCNGMNFSGCGADW